MRMWKLSELSFNPEKDNIIAGASNPDFPDEI